MEDIWHDIHLKAQKYTTSKIYWFTKLNIFIPLRLNLIINLEISGCESKETTVPIL